MTDRILGPRGCLPPGEWAVGARVAEIIDNNASDVVLFDTFDPDGLTGWEHNDGSGGGSYHYRRGELALDLTEGCLSHSTRALLALVAPDVPQPDCAPGWMRFRAEDGTAGWVLTQSPQPNAWRDWCFRTPAYGSADFIPGADLHVVGASEESNPRRALAMALTAAAEAKS